MHATEGDSCEGNAGQDAQGVGGHVAELERAAGREALAEFDRDP